MASSPTPATTASLTRFPYLFRNIKQFPRRLLHPPSPSVPRVGTVRSLTLKPCYQVSLDDVINGRHLPPLGRKEFEDFLYFKEFSVENLYFHVWFLSYQAEWMATPDAPNSKLAMNYTRAKDTFFTPGSPWELNLPQRTLQQLLQHQGPPHPSALAEVRFEVNNYLTDSLTRFIVQNGGNAGRYRGLFAVSLGIILIGVGLIPIILHSLAHDHSWNQKLTRLAGLPALWFGFATLLMGFHGVCILIFLFGDARQLYPYELRRPAISSPISYTPSFALNPNLIANNGNANAEVRPSLAALALDNVGSNKRHSSVPVTISPRPERTEFVHLPDGAHHHHHHHQHADSLVSKADYDSVGPLDFESYNEAEEESGDSKRTGNPAMSVATTPTTASTTRCGSTRRYPDMPLAFDFDALPIPPTMRVPDWKATENPSPSTASAPFSFATWQQQVGTAPSGAPYGASHGSSTSTNKSTAGGDTSFRRKYHAVKNWEWNKERTVFSPLTLVLDPIITRTQWEIVMRSCLFALIISLVIAIGSLGLP